MKNALQQFYSLLREAMFANKMTASDISARKGVHYTYIYNSIRGNSNITMQTAESLANAAGYRLVVSFEPLAGEPALVGNMDPTGPLYSERKRRTKAEEADAAAATLVPATKIVIDDEGKVAGLKTGPAHDLDAEIEALLADA